MLLNEHSRDHERLGLNKKLRDLARDVGGAGTGNGVGVETDPIVGAINGIVKADGSGNIEAAISGTDYENPLTFGAGLTRTGDTVDCDITQYTDADAIAAIQADASWNATDWDTAYGWGDHSTEGYLKNITGENFADLSDIPAHPGVVDKMLNTTATGYEWIDQPAGGGGEPGGIDKQVQFNDGGEFGGDSGLTYDKDIQTLFSKQALFGGVDSSLIAWDLTANTESQIKFNDDAASTVVTDEIIADASLIGGKNTEDVSVTGKINEAFDLDGTNDYVETNLTYDLSGSWSISIWVNPDAIPDFSDYVTLISQKGNRDVLQFFKFGATQYLSFQFDDGLTNNIIIYTSTDIIGSWQNFVLTFDGTTLTAYWNGEEMGTQTPTVSSGSEAIMIGADNAGANLIDGQVDGYMFFDKVLSDIEIRQLYNGGDGSEEPTGEEQVYPTAVSSEAISPLYATSYDDLFVNGLMELEGNLYTKGGRIYIDDDSIQKLTNGRWQLPSEIHVGSDAGSSWAADQMGLKVLYRSTSTNENFAGYFQKNVENADTSNNQAGVLSMILMPSTNENSYYNLVGHRYRVEFRGQGHVQGAAGVWGTSAIYGNWGGSVGHFYGGLFRDSTAAGEAYGLGSDGDFVIDGKVFFATNVSLTTGTTNKDTNLYRNAANELRTDDSFQAAGYKSSDGSAGISDTFTNGDGATVTVKNGIITAIT